MRIWHERLLRLALLTNGGRPSLRHDNHVIVLEDKVLIKVGAREKARVVEYETPDSASFIAEDSDLIAFCKLQKSTGLCDELQHC